MRKLVTYSAVSLGMDYGALNFRQHLAKRLEGSDAVMFAMFPLVNGLIPCLDATTLLAM